MNSSNSSYNMSSSTPGPAMEFLGRVAYELHQMYPMIPTYIHLLGSAIFPIYTAAHASLARPSSAAPAKKSKENANINELQDEEISPTIEALTPSDAILFPLLAGATLVSLYWILKWLQDPALLNYYLGLYFAVVGLYFQVKFVKDVLATIRSVLLPTQYSYRGKLWTVDVKEKCFVAAADKTGKDVRKSPLPGVFSIFSAQYNSAIWSLRQLVYTRLNLKFSVYKIFNVITIIDTLDLVSIVIAVPLVAYHTFIDKPWFLTNLLGFSFCYGSLQVTTPGTSWTGTLILCALFFYDIYFVFFTPFMVTVATKLDVPIKLLFPQPSPCKRPKDAAEGSKAMEKYLQCLAKKRTMAMLGLGDIVVPGLMLAFALRFDLYLYYKNLSSPAKAEKSGDQTVAKEKKDLSKTPYLPATGSWGERFWTNANLHSPELQAKQFPKPYFYASIAGYVVGMIVTILVMQIAQHAQPALLYLVPGVLISLWGVALVRGDFGALWSYSEVPEDEKDDKKKTEEESKEKKIDNAQEDKTEPANSTADPEKKHQTKVTEQKTSDKNAADETKKEDKPKSEDTDSETHLIQFSLTIINPNKKLIVAKLDKSDTAKESTFPATEKDDASTSTDEWSSEGDEEVEALENHDGTVKLRASWREDITAKVNASKGKANADGSRGGGDTDEPALKRIRKA